jgi:hypothetical protein
MCFLLTANAGQRNNMAMPRKRAFVSPDRLHMNDCSYACIVKLLGIAIAEAATRSIAAVAVHPAAISAEPDVY